MQDLAHRRPGQGVREKAEELAEIERENGRFGFWVRRVRNDYTDEPPYRVGANAEEKVGARLGQLRPMGWHTLHSITVGTNGADVDHLVIGPGGVFTVNTDFPRGREVCAGQGIPVAC